MSETRWRFDPALLLVPVWVVYFFLHVQGVVRTGLAEPVVYASPPGADGYPRVAGFLIERGSAASGLRVGDVLLRVGERDLSGVGYLGFQGLAIEAAAGRDTVALEYARDEQRGRTDLRLLAPPLPWARMGTLLLTALCGLLVLLRAPGGQGRRFYLGTLTAALALTSFKSGSSLQVHASQLSLIGWGAVQAALTVRWAVAFPSDLPVERRLGDRWPWLLAAALVVARGSYVLGGPIPGPLVSVAVLALDIVQLSTLLAVVLRNYVVCGPRGQRRMRWALYGLALALVPAIANAIQRLAAPESPLGAVSFSLAMLAGCGLPLGMTIAIVRDDLFDIDELISRTGSYIVLGSVLVVSLVTIVPWLADVASHALDLDATLARAGIGTLLAAGAAVAAVGTRPIVARLLLPDRAELLGAMAKFDAELASEARGEDRAARACEMLEVVLGPRSRVAFWAFGGEFAPVSVAGQAAPGVLRSTDQLIAALGSVRAPLVAPRWSAKRESLGGIDRAILETLGAALVAPIRASGALVGFLALGPKRSGDVYADAERAYVERLCERIVAGAPDAPAPAASSARSSWLAAAARSVVAIVDDDRSGSGVFVGAGLVLTSLHVVATARFAMVRLPSGEVVRGRVEGRSESHDLALVCIDGPDLPPFLPLGRAASLAPGDTVFAVGSPGTRFGSMHGTVTRGVVSAHRTLPSPSGSGADVRVLQTDATLNPGNSGGPMFDEQGRIVGIVALRDLDARGVGFAVAIEEALEVFPLLRAADRPV